MEAFTWFGIAVLVFICAALSGPMVSERHPHDRYGVGDNDDE